MAASAGRYAGDHMTNPRHLSHSKGPAAGSSSQRAPIPCQPDLFSHPPSVAGRMDESNSSKSPQHVAIENVFNKSVSLPQLAGDHRNNSVAVLFDGRYQASLGAQGGAVGRQNPVAQGSVATSSLLPLHIPPRNTLLRRPHRKLRHQPIRSATRPAPTQSPPSHPLGQLFDGSTFVPPDSLNSVSALGPRCLNPDVMAAYPAIPLSLLPPPTTYATAATLLMLTGGRPNPFSTSAARADGWSPGSGQNLPAQTIPRFPFRPPAHPIAYSVNDPVPDPRFYRSPWDLEPQREAHDVALRSLVVRRALLSRYFASKAVGSGDNAPNARRRARLVMTRPIPEGDVEVSRKRREIEEVDTVASDSLVVANECRALDRTDCMPYEQQRFGRVAGVAVPETQLQASNNQEGEHCRVRNKDQKATVDRRHAGADGGSSHVGPNPRAILASRVRQLVGLPASRTGACQGDDLCKDEDGQSRPRKRPRASSFSSQCETVRTPVRSQVRACSDEMGVVLSKASAKRESGQEDGEQPLKRPRMARRGSLPSSLKLKAHTVARPGNLSSRPDGVPTVPAFSLFVRPPPPPPPPAPPRSPSVLHVDSPGGADAGAWEERKEGSRECRFVDMVIAQGNLADEGRQGGNRHAQARLVRLRARLDKLREARRALELMDVRRVEERARAELRSLACKKLRKSGGRNGMESGHNAFDVPRALGVAAMRATLRRRLERMPQSCEREVERVLRLRSPCAFAKILALAAGVGSGGEAVDTTGEERGRCGVGIAGRSGELIEGGVRAGLDSFDFLTLMVVRAVVNREDVPTAESCSFSSRLRNLAAQIAHTTAELDRAHRDACEEIAGRESM